MLNIINDLYNKYKASNKENVSIQYLGGNNLLFNSTIMEYVRIELLLNTI